MRGTVSIRLFNFSLGEHAERRDVTVYGWNCTGCRQFCRSKAKVLDSSFDRHSTPTPNLARKRESTARPHSLVLLVHQTRQAGTLHLAPSDLVLRIHIACDLASPTLFSATEAPVVIGALASAPPPPPCSFYKSEVSCTAAPGTVPCVWKHGKCEDAPPSPSPPPSPPSPADPHVSFNAAGYVPTRTLADRLRPLADNTAGRSLMHAGEGCGQSIPPVSPPLLPLPHSPSRSVVSLSETMPMPCLFYADMSAPNNDGIDCRLYLELASTSYTVQSLNVSIDGSFTKTNNFSFVGAVRNAYV